MSVKAFIPSGQTALTVNGLHQWDYGQKLEIHDDTLPALIEVHFACVGMTEAVVRSCAVVQGVAEAAIPDPCLEQTAPITAYIFEVGADSGATTKAIVLTVSPRPRPQTVGTITPAISDKYTELMGAVNEQVNALKAGNVTVNKALTAEKATTAGTADKATQADKATTADALTDPDSISVGFATEAGFADEARWSVSAFSADKTKKLEIANTINPEEHTITQPGLYMVAYFVPSSSGGGVSYTDIIYVPYLNVTTACSSPGYRPTSGSYEQVGVIYSGDTQTFSIKNVVGDAYITHVWLLATEQVGG